MSGSSGEQGSYHPCSLELKYLLTYQVLLGTTFSALLLEQPVSPALPSRPLIPVAILTHFLSQSLNIGLPWGPILDTLPVCRVSCKISSPLLEIVSPLLDYLRGT